jgi:hypothetical protein|tara:strand:+ start:127 stop:381 length:255 start_codon:yes stop_codon:yes gene_type:complete
MTEHADRIATQILRAALSSFEANRQEALATLDLYLHNPVAIGEHPSIVGEVLEATKRLAEAEEAIGALQRNFVPEQVQEAEDNE